MIAQNRAKRKEHCNLRIGALSKNAMTFTTRSRTTRTSHASSANWSSQTAVRRHRAEWLTFLTTPSARSLKVAKTRLAIEYAWRHASDYKDAMLFVSARSPVDLRANLAELCSPLVLNLPEWNQPEEIIRLAAVFRWLSEHSGWLLILDNADIPEAAAEVEKTLPQLQNGEVIITSRIADWSTAVQPVELDVLGILHRRLAKAEEGTDLCAVVLYGAPFPVIAWELLCRDAYLPGDVGDGRSRQTVTDTSS